MKKILLILSCIPLIGIGQQILSKTTIIDGTIVKYCEYYEDGKIKSITSYGFNERWQEEDTTIIYYNETGDTSSVDYGFISSCSLNKTYNFNQKVILIYWDCSDGIPGDREIWSEGIKEFRYDERDRLIEKKECLGNGNTYYTHCYDDMRVTYYHYNNENDLLEKIVSIRENRDQFFEDTVFNKIETIEKRIRYDYDMYGNNIRITTFNASAEIISKDIMTYENNLLQKKESMAEDTIVIDNQYNQDNHLIRIQENGYDYYTTMEYNDMNQLIFTSDYGPGLDYECYYKYNKDSNIINEIRYEISDIDFLDSCINSVYLYNDLGNLIEKMDYYIDTDGLDKIGDNNFDIIENMKNSLVNLERVYKEKRVTNVKYEYY